MNKLWCHFYQNAINNRSYPSVANGKGSRQPDTNQGDRDGGGHSSYSSQSQERSCYHELLFTRRRVEKQKDGTNKVTCKERRRKLYKGNKTVKMVL